MARTDRQERKDVRKNTRAKRREDRQERKDVRKNVKSERKGPREVGPPPGADTGMESLGRVTNTSAAVTNRERAARRALLGPGDRGGFTEFQGGGGWSYRKYSNGEILITDAPSSNTRAIGMTLRPGDRFYDAIDAEMANRPLEAMVQPTPSPETPGPEAEAPETEAPQMAGPMAGPPDIRETDLTPNLGETDLTPNLGESPVEPTPLVGPGGLVPTLPHLRRGDNNRRGDTVFGGPMRAMRGAAQTLEEEFPSPPGGQRATYDRASAAGRQMRGELGKTLGDIVDALTPEGLKELGAAVARRSATEPGPKF